MGSEKLVATELQNVPSETLSGPKVPVFVKTLIRPLTCMRICVGPTSPMLSGGMNPDSELPTPLKLTPIVCGAMGTGGADCEVAAASSGIGGQCESGGGAFGSGSSS